MQGRAFSIDVFGGRHRELMLAEEELEEILPRNHLDIPVFALKEVTGDPFFSGGNLAMLTKEEFRQGLAHYL